MLNVDLEQLDTEGKDLTSQTENLNPEEIDFVNFLLDCKGINSAILIGRFDLYLDTEKEKGETLKHLQDHNGRNLINLANFIF